MAEAIRMPLLSDTMKEGVIAAWHKKVGDQVKADDVIAEVETDKATMEVIPYVEGTLLYIGPKEGEAAKVNDIIAIVGKPGEDFQSLLAAEGKAESATIEQKQESEAPAGKTASHAAIEKLLQQVTVVRMPLLSDTMKEGKIVAWHKKVGDQVKSDDVLAEVETDKATMEVVGYAEGTLLYTGPKEGESAKVNDIIAIVGKEGTDIQPILDAEKQPTQAASAPAAAPAQPKAAVAAPAPAPTAPSGTSVTPEGRIKASPLARKLAAEKGIDLTRVKGTGDDGRIIKRDIDQYLASSAAQAPAATTPVFTAAAEEGYEDKPVTQMRKVIAQRLSQSKYSAPHFYLTISVDMRRMVDARKALNEISEVKISFNDILIKAVAMALRKHPEVNSSWMGDFIRTYKHIHIGSAVAIDDGLIVPVIRFADQKSIAQIAAEAKTLYEKARNRKLQPQDFSGNTFTISNLGMLGIEEFTAIINPPDSCILAVGAIQDTPVVQNGQVIVAPVMKLTMSCDHRVVDGAVGARFLQTLKQMLENPLAMLL
ncbi:pyruvate dehydrogenase complex dihydrolipoamide acetyltransferase [Thermoflavifilum thermophilum]|uniref:Acetyltransferase component of pyruvate dehydrogenase complex n=1 Tax=Thermoflavifilum thermophilum TaxID=1393122 RepID=A0A1I7N862_9BACT|nr:pyruvate dehydrogenase complex dihydrolipoamide acetyltransferase [Thermoflavifilum thermophilum]SFV30864.1 pyruvate dehydrogenase E2 component (dihydrolipoamide acetyltransferase) [Thermoflavifilum thermophilum]